VLRKSDFSLTREQEQLRDSFASFFEHECPTTRVRDAEPLGFDEKFWQQIVGLGALTMGLPPEHGGDGATLVDLALVSEQFGRHIAPVPLVEAIVTARVLARVDREAARRLGRLADGTQLAVLALTPAHPGIAQLVPGGAVATSVVGLVGNELVIATSDTPRRAPANLGSVPLAWWDFAAPDVSRVVLAMAAPAHAYFERARAEWKLLMAATMVGLAQGALDLSVQYAKDRVAFGVPIGTFQAIAHPLADVATAVEGARRLVWKAAWFADHEPEEAPVLVSMAYLHATQTANRAATVGIHTQGGLGFTLESDMQLFFRRAKGWVLAAGDPQMELCNIADLLYGPRR
jgi:alkylation response protein AidB-like acyl-CoA dehydrogenase